VDAADWLELSDPPGLEQARSVHLILRLSLHAPEGLKGCFGADTIEAYCPIELASDWDQTLPRSADAVVERMRLACLYCVRLSRTASRLVPVDEHTSGRPAVWLHPGGTNIAWAIVDIGERDRISLNARPRSAKKSAGLAAIIAAMAYWRSEPVGRVA
jgi:hypothetical protein